MGVTFVHSADWQIGKPFGNLPEDKAALLRAARLDAIDRIASVAVESRARHILVAGDVFDHVKPPQKIFGPLLARLADHTGLLWHLMPGNHDPARPGSVWDEVARIRPMNVRVHMASDPVEIEPGILLLPAPLHTKAMSSDPTAFMDRISSPRGTIRIGMAHGSVRGFSSDGEAAIPIDIARAAKARLDYLALGDWHGTIEIDKRTWYSGTHEPDAFKANSPGHVLVVSIEAQGVEPMVRSVATHHYKWKRQSLALSSLFDLEQYTSTLTTELNREATPRARVLLKLDLTGRVPLADYGAIRQRLDSLADGLAHLDADASAIETSAVADDLTALGGGSIGIVAGQLAATRDAGDPAQQPTAVRALRTLARLVGQTS